MKKMAPIGMFALVMFALVVGVFLVKLLDTVVQKVGESWTGTNTNMVILAVLGLIAAPLLSMMGNSSVGGGTRSAGTGYKLLGDNQAQKPFGYLTDGQTAEAEWSPAQPKYNDTFFGEEVDL